VPVPNPTLARAVVLGFAIVFPGALAAGSPDPLDPGLAEQLQKFERAIAGDPEDLKLAADYRQVVIGAGRFDRSIDLFERLAKQAGAGVNVKISLALALVDKIPTSGELRRAYIGHDALNALTESIAQRPSVLAYYVRGKINLHFDRFPMNRMTKGIVDLNVALSLVTDDTPPALVAQVYTTLGDGHFKLKDPLKARDVWTSGAVRFPDDPHMKQRLELDGDALRHIVGSALASGRRSDTTLNNLLPVR
jgi:hypothetical protein